MFRRIVICAAVAASVSSAALSTAGPAFAAAADPYVIECERKGGTWHTSSWGGSCVLPPKKEKCKRRKCPKAQSLSMSRD